MIKNRKEDHKKSILQRRGAFYTIMSLLSVCVVIVIAYIVIVFLKDYRTKVYKSAHDSIINSMYETSNSVLKNVNSNFIHNKSEINLIGNAFSQNLKVNSFNSVDDISYYDRVLLSDSARASNFDYCVILNERGYGIFADNEGNIEDVNLFSSEAFSSIAESDKEFAINYLSNPVSDQREDSITFSYRCHSIVLIGILNEETLNTVLNVSAFSDNAAFLVTTKSGFVLYRAGREILTNTVNLMAYLEASETKKDYVDVNRKAIQDISTSSRLGVKGKTDLYIDHKQYKCVYSSVEDTEWQFIMMIPSEYIMSSAKNINNDTLNITKGVTVILCGAFILWFIILYFGLRVRNAKNSVKREKIFTLMNNYVPNVIVIANAETQRIHYVSRNFERVLGCESPTHSLTEMNKLLDMVTEESRESVKKLYLSDEFLQKKQAGVLVSFVRKDNQEVIKLKIMAYLIIEKDQKEKFITLTAEDVTEEMNLRDSLKEAAVAAESANRAKSVFLANMSHDIRTPMNAIMGLTNIALEDDSDDINVRECLTKIGTSSQILLGLINDILDMSKIESGKLQLNRRQFSIAEKINDLISVFSSQTITHKQHFEVFEKQVNHELVLGDDTRVSRIITNIIGNSIKFTPEGGTIRFGLEENEVDESHSEYILTVQDTGVGMSKEFLDIIFEPFSQEQNERQKLAKGTGLGMSITKKFVDMMNGTIQVQSELGKGTKFTVTLPLETVAYKNRINLEVGTIYIAHEDSNVCKEATRILTQLGIANKHCLGTADITEITNNVGTNKNILLISTEYLKMLTDCHLKDVHIVVIATPNTSEQEIVRLQREYSGVIVLPIFRKNLIDCISDITGAKRTDKKQLELGKRTILVAEDSEVNMEIACHMLIKMLGAEVVKAENGKVAVDEYLKYPAGYFDVILMDMQMPVMDGMEATSIIRKSGRMDAAKIPIIAFTANAFSEDRDRAIAGE